MEHDIDRSGLMSLNPMYWWKYVMKEKEKDYITATIYAKTSPEIDELMEKHPEMSFNFIQVCLEDGCPQLGNVRVKWVSKIQSDEEKGKLWSQTDYLLVPSEYLLEAFEAGLSGVKYFTNEKEFLNALKTPLTKVNRIENWENTQKDIDKQKNLC